MGKEKIKKQQRNVGNLDDMVLYIYLGFILALIQEVDIWLLL